MTSANPQPTETLQSRPFWRKKRWIVLLVLGIGLIIGHRSVLEFASQGLICQESKFSESTIGLIGIQSPDPQAEWKFVSQQYHDGKITKIIFIKPAPSRLIQLGILSDQEAETRTEMEALKLPADAISFVTAKQQTSRDFAYCVQAILENHPPTQKFTLFTTPFQSRHLRYTLDWTLPREQAEQVQVSVVLDTEYSASNWWKSMTGIKLVAQSYFSLIHLYFTPETETFIRDWDADQYIQNMK